MRKTRFQQEISGDLGEFWQKEAIKELEGYKEDIEEGNITIDDNGVARNKIGRAVMSDLLERLMYLHLPNLNEEATIAAREKEVEESIAEYKRNYQPPTDEYLAEMKAAFEEGTTVVDIISGATIQL